MLDVIDFVYSNFQFLFVDNNGVDIFMLLRYDLMDRIEVVRFEFRRIIVRVSLIDNSDRTLNYYYG